MTTITASTEERRAAARVPLREGTGVFDRIIQWYSRRTYGDVLDNGLALLHHKRVLWSVLRFERGVAKWKHSRRDADLGVRWGVVNGSPAMFPSLDGELDSVVTAVVGGGRIREIYFVRNPEKLEKVHEQRDVRR